MQFKTLFSTTSCFNSYSSNINKNLLLLPLILARGFGRRKLRYPSEFSGLKNSSRKSSKLWPLTPNPENNNRSANLSLTKSICNLKALIFYRYIIFLHETN
uniref:Uncharacterized protein n=1 Tax=Porodaedalea pini TaxID=108901 RepID=A0A5B9RCA2_9AGAM|nr:hypothetical protein PPIT_000068 [Porodaedalea pini]QEG56949.1 hypothetical protein PPIT_000068 [Porodaedalea pini]